MAAAALSGAVALPAAPSAATTLSDLANRAQRQQSGLFGSAEFRSSSLTGLPQWQRVLTKMRRERAAFEACAADRSRCTTPVLKSWGQIINDVAQRSRLDRIKAVNRFFNRWPYKTDTAVYGRSEYWATPSEFMARSGDCEDYSIAKFFALRQVGFRNEELRIVVLWDEIRALGHAVLAVETQGGTLILDSLSDLVVNHQRYRHYIPQVSMNESARWAHVTPGRKIPSPLARRRQ